MSGECEVRVCDSVAVAPGTVSNSDSQRQGGGASSVTLKNVQWDVGVHKTVNHTQSTHKTWNPLQLLQHLVAGRQRLGERLTAGAGTFGSRNDLPLTVRSAESGHLLSLFLKHTFIGMAF